MILKNAKEIINELKNGNKDTLRLAYKLCILVDESELCLLKSILEDMDGKHPEYHYEIVETYIKALEDSIKTLKHEE